MTAELETRAADVQAPRAPVIAIRHGVKRFGGVTALDDAELVLVDVAR